MRLTLAVATAVLLLAPAIPAHPSGEAHVEALVLADGTGLVGVPAGEPDTLVIIARGYGHKAESHRAHLQHLADQGYLAIAMDFGAAGFPLAKGTQESLDALAWAEATYPSIDRTVLYSVSMGTAVAGMMLAQSDAFDLWVVNEGLSMLHETWAGATALSPSGNAFAVKAKADIEQECEGTPAEQPLCYRARSAALLADTFRLDGVVLAHGLNDGLVPYDQGREMVGALRAQGIPADFYTVVRSPPGSEGTTVTGYTPLGGVGFAGHGSESNDAHALTGLTFALLDDVLAGRIVPSNAEHVVDGELGTLP